MRMSTSAKRKSTNGRVGRPPAGDRGERVQDYPQVSFRLPTTVRDKLVALSNVGKQPQWRLIVESVECYLRDLPRPDQAQIARRYSTDEQKICNKAADGFIWRRTAREARQSAPDERHADPERRVLRGLCASKIQGLFRH